MSAFNTLIGVFDCPACGMSAEQRVQFKYGDCWQHNYSLGDELRWGGNDVGTAGLDTVEVEGLGGPCPRCLTDFLEFRVKIVGNRLTAVTAGGELLEP